MYSNRAETSPRLRIECSLALHKQTRSKVSNNTDCRHPHCSDSSLRRNLFLTAVIDEVDQAIAGLQTARQLLSELQRSGEIPPGRGIPSQAQYPSAEPPVRSSPPLRYGGVTVAEAARILGLSEEHVRRLLRRGELEGIAYGGRVGWRLTRAYVEEVAAEMRAAREGQETARRSSKEPPSRVGRRPQRR